MTKATILFLVLILAIIPAVSASSITNIDSCRSITQPGEYILTQDLISQGSCFSILSSNVVLNLNGHSVSNDPLYQQYGTGIFNSGINYYEGVSNVVIENGEISNYWAAIYFQGGSNNLVSNIQAYNNYNSLYFSSSSNNIVQDSSFYGSDPNNQWGGDISLVSGSANNRLINVQYDKVYIPADLGNSYSREWYANIKAINNNCQPLANVNIDSKVSYSSNFMSWIPEISGVTDSNGELKTTFIAYTDDGYPDYTTHKLTASKTGFASSIINFNENNNINIILKTSYDSIETPEEQICTQCSPTYCSTTPAVVFTRLLLGVPPVIDLELLSVKPIQVIEDADSNNNNLTDLIENKPIMIKAKARLIDTTNSISEGILNNVRVRLEIFDITNPANRMQVYSAEKLVNLSVDSSVTENQIKTGADVIQFFPSDENDSVTNRQVPDGAKTWKPGIKRDNNLNPAGKKDYEFNITLDPKNELNILRQAKQTLSVKAETGWMKNKISISPNYESQLADNDQAQKILIDNIEFFKKIFPINPQASTNQDAQGVYGTDVDAIMGISSQKGINSNELLAKLLKNRIYTESVQGQDDYILSIFPFVVESTFFKKRNPEIAEVHEVKGESNGSPPIKISKKPVILIPATINIMTAKSLAWIYSSYLGLTMIDSWKSLSKSRGPISANGWCLDQETGASCGARINVYPNSLYNTVHDLNQHTENDFTATESEDKLYWLNEYSRATNTDNILGVRYYDLTAYAPSDNSWISKENYEKLIKKLIRFK